MVYSKGDVEDYVGKRLRNHSTENLDHFKRVYSMARKLSKTYDDEVLHAACFLHDIEPGDNRKSALHALAILKGKLSDAKLHHIEHAILHHALEGEPKSMEAILLHDANLLEYLGIIGLIRMAFEFKEKQADLQSLIKTIKILRKQISEKLILKQSKDKAAERLYFMDLAIHRLEEEIKQD